METDCSAELIGLTALVETGGLEATGSITSIAGATVTVACDPADWSKARLEDVVICVFTPGALYRITGPAVVSGSDLVAGPAAVEKIQRRQWPRRHLDLAVTVCPVADGRRVEGIPGRSVDLGIGGVCVETLRPVEGEGDPMVIVSLPDGTTIVSGTTTVAVEDLGDGWRYRLAFQDLDAHDAGRLADLISID
jgi:hypothetical protein